MSGLGDTQEETVFKLRLGKMTKNGKCVWASISNKRATSSIHDLAFGTILVLTLNYLKSFRFKKKKTVDTPIPLTQECSI